MTSLLKDPQKFYNKIVAHLSKDQKELAKLLRENAPITETKSLHLVGFNFEEKSTSDLADVKLTFVPKAGGQLLLAFYPEEENVQLSEFVLTELQKSFDLGDAPRAFTVPEGKMVCAFDLGARLEGKLSGATSVGSGSLSFFVQGGATAGAKFFKLLDSKLGARDAAVDTATGLKTFFQLVSQPPAPGEIVVAEFGGSLSFGAEIGYGLEVSGTKSLDAGIEDVTLQSDYEVKAKLGAKVSFRLERDVVTIVRGTGADQWVNVSFLKKRGSEAGVAVNLNVDAKLSTKMISGGEEQEVGAFIDTLLSRTPLPDLMTKLKKWDTAQELEANGIEFIDSVVGQVSQELRDLLEDPAAEIDEFLQPIREVAAKLIEDIEMIDAKVAGFIESATDQLDALSDIDEAVALIEGLESTEDLLASLSGEHGKEVRKVLAILSKTLDLDLSQVGWLEKSFAQIHDLAGKYSALEKAVRNDFEERYRWLKMQLNVDDAIALLKKVTDAATLQELLDKKIIWVELYLAKQLGTAVDRIVDSLEPALAHLKKLTNGYDKLVGKAKETLETVLNREVSLQASLAWQRLSTHQALVSVDLNLAEDAGRDAMKDLLLGKIGDVVLDRLTNAHAIRFQKSYFLDQIRSSVSLKMVINGRERLGMRTVLTTSKTLLEPTPTGEIWVQESAVETSVHRQNRRAILNVHTLFEVSLQEIYERQGNTLKGQGLQLRGYGLRYNYNETLRGVVPAAALRAQLRDVISKIDFEIVPPADYDDLCEGIEDIGRLGDFGEPRIDIDVGFSRDALVDIFSEPVTADLRDRVREAYSKAVHVTFGEFDRVIFFYENKKDTGFDVAEVQMAQWGLAGPEKMLAQNVTNSYGTFSNILAKIHRDVFLKIGKLSGGTPQENEIQRTKLVKKMRNRLRGLGKQMSWINRIEIGDRTKDFTMAIFAQMIDSADRFGGIAVHYGHPISEEKLTLRVDDPLDG